MNISCIVVVISGDGASIRLIMRFCVWRRFNKCIYMSDQVEADFLCVVFVSMEYVLWTH